MPVNVDLTKDEATEYERARLVLADFIDWLLFEKDVMLFSISERSPMQRPDEDALISEYLDQPDLSS